MKCHRHVDRDAIAICTHCTKGLCAECARDVPGGTACGERCAEALGLAERVAMGAERSQALQRSLPRFAGLFLVVLGLSTMGWGISRTSDLLITTGFVSAMGGAAMYWIGARYRSDAR